MTTKVPSILISRFESRQQEVFAKSIKAVTDALNANIGTAASATALQAVLTALNALQAQVAALEAEISALSGSTEYIAAVNLTSSQAVYAVNSGYVGLADNTIPTTAQSLIGVTTSSAAAGAKVKVTGVGGVVTDPTWAWTAFQPVYLAASGAMTQTLPVAGVLAQVGIATSATTMLVAPYAAVTGPLVLTQVPAGQTVNVPYDGGALVPPGQTLQVTGQLVADGPVDVLPDGYPLPSYYHILAGDGVYVPAHLSMLYSTATGLTLDGDLVVDGYAVMV